MICRQLYDNVCFSRALLLLFAHTYGSHCYSALSHIHTCEQHCSCNLSYANSLTHTWTTRYIANYASTDLGIFCRKKFSSHRNHNFKCNFRFEIFKLPT